mmetsp:Transcript_26443/g.61396  ORF Transcript_26443/g.61396 Transcript_26443/m.61396 type:complete len:278 (+) Transcript_26443:434-1267(+)
MASASGELKPCGRSGVRAELRVGVTAWFSRRDFVGLRKSTRPGLGESRIFVDVSMLLSEMSLSLVRSKNGFRGGRSPVGALEGDTESRTSGSSSCSKKLRFSAGAAGCGRCFAGACPRGVPSHGFAAALSPLALRGKSREAEELRITGLIGRPLPPGTAKDSLRPARRYSRALSSALERSSCSRVSSRCRSRSCSDKWETCCLSSDWAFCESDISRLAWSSCCCSCRASCWLRTCAALARSSWSWRSRWAPKSTARTRLAKANECAVSVASRAKGLT